MRNTGEARWFALKATRFTGSGDLRVVVAHEDITEPRRSAARLLQINSLYRALSDANDAIARVRDRDTLLAEVAGIALRAGLFKTVKIWMCEPGTSFVRAAVCIGQAGPYLDTEFRGIDLSGPEAFGPTGVAIREGRADVCNDLDEPRSLPWRDSNARAGLRSSAAFPLREDGVVVGTLSVYATRVGYFDATFVELLGRIAAQLTWGLDHLRREAKRAAAEAALRESEERFRSLAELSAEWYWQQDADLRFTSNCNGTEIDAGLAADADLGRTRWELSGAGEAEWDRHKATLAAREPFRNFEMKRSFPDGSVRDISISGTPIFDASGEFRGYRGIGRDITRRKREERILALEHRVASCVASTDDTTLVLGEVIRAICETQGWSFGAYFQADDDARRLRVRSVWTAPDGASDALLEQVRGLTVVPGEGISGRVWQTGQPLWVPDVIADRKVLLADFVSAAGFRGSFCFPSIADGRTTGVMIFFSREVREPDARLLSAAQMIGTQLGQCLQRKQAEDALRDSEKRYRALTELSSDWYWEQDEHQRFTCISEGVQRRSGVPVGSVLGHTRWETGIDYDPAARAAMEAYFAARVPFRDFVYRRIDADGSARELSISGEPMYDASGRFVGYRGVGKDVTERQRAEDRLRFQAMLLNTVGDAVMATDAAGNIAYWSDAAERLYGWTAAEAAGHVMEEMLAPADLHASIDTTIRAAIREGVWRGDMVGCRRDGTTFAVHVTLAPLQDASGAVTGVVGVSRDVSDLKHAERALRASARQQQLIAAFGQRALASTDLDTLLEQAALAVTEGMSVPFCKILQLAPDGQSLVARAGLGWGENWFDRHATDSGPKTLDHHVFAAQEATVIDDYATDSRFTASAFLAFHGVRSGASVMVGGAGGPFGVLGVYASEPGRFGPDSAVFLQSIANTLATAIDRIGAEERVAYLAQFDVLTGLPNRSLFHDRLALTLTQAERNAWTVGVMFVDLDRFKDVNDSFGHGTGDQLLRLVGERLQACVRSGDTVGRLGGDEFAIVLSNLARADDATVVAQHVIEALTQPFAIGGREVAVTASVGIAVYPVDGHDPEILLNRSDAAMYLAKQQGRNGFHFYTEELHARVARRMGLEADLRHAVEHDEFVLHYQPQVSLDGGRVVGVEALVRWQHPVRGLLLPAEFIAIAEETGLIVPIGRWVAETACEQAAKWHRSGHRGGLSVAINVSPLEIRRGSMVETVRAALERSGLDPRFLELELTETLIMDGAEAFVRTLTALKATGVAIAIDDFGTGYSSLGYLKRFPVDTLKIDRLFIRDIAADKDDAAIAQAIIAMSHHLQLRVIAEGVETQAQADVLHSFGCDHAQGFLFGRPVAAEELDAILAGECAAVAKPESR